MCGLFDRYNVKAVRVVVVVVAVAGAETDVPVVASPKIHHDVDLVAAYDLNIEAWALTPPLNLD